MNFGRKMQGGRRPKIEAPPHAPGHARTEREALEEDAETFLKMRWRLL